MKFLDFSLKKVVLPFKNPLHIGKKTLKTKTSLYLTLTFSQGFSSTGEISLLPGLIDISEEEAKEEIHHFLRPLKGCSLNKDLQVTRPFFNLFPSAPLSSPVLFAIEMALFKGIENSFPALTFKELSVPVNDLITCLDDGIPLLDGKSKTLKIKIGRGKTQEEEDREIHFLNQLATPKGPSLRLDGNRNFSLEGMLAYLEKLRPQTKKSIEYIEEPLEDISRWSEVYKETGLFLGIDESLLEYEDLQNLPLGTKALIIKPSFHGGISKTLSLFQKARKRNLKCVISSTFETSLGLYALALLAKIQGNNPAGLNTFDYLEEHNPPYQITQKQGWLTFKDSSLKKARINNLHPF